MIILVATFLVCAAIGMIVGLLTFCAVGGGLLIADWLKTRKTKNF